MRLIKPAALVAWAKQYPRAAPGLSHWYEVVRAARWANFAPTRRDFPHADQVRVASLRPVTVFNVAGNHFRLITAIHYDAQRVFLLDFLTHADYDGGRWIEQL